MSLSHNLKSLSLDFTQFLKIVSPALHPRTLLAPQEPELLVDEPASSCCPSNFMGVFLLKTTTGRKQILPLPGSLGVFSGFMVEGGAPCRILPDCSFDPWKRLIVKDHAVAHLETTRVDPGLQRSVFTASWPDLRPLDPTLPRDSVWVWLGTNEGSDPSSDASSLAWW